MNLGIVCSGCIRVNSPQGTYAEVRLEIRRLCSHPVFVVFLDLGSFCLLYMRYSCLQAQVPEPVGQQQRQQQQSLKQKP